MAIHADGKKAHVDGPGGYVDLTRRELTDFMIDVMATWAVATGE